MNTKLLSLTPRRYLCPYCGEWHTWRLPHDLASQGVVELECEYQRPNCLNRKMQICFSDGYCIYKTNPNCSIGKLDIYSRIPIEDIVESSKEPRVTFDVPFTTAEKVGINSDCRKCGGLDRCLMCKLGDENNSRHMHITFGFEFEQSDYEKFSTSALVRSKEKELQEREQAISSKEQAFEKREDAIASKEQVFQRPQAKDNKEDTTMTNNIINMNMEFGPNNDENIISTIMGVAVKNGDSWRIYDKERKEITDVGDMQLGNLPIFIMPTTKLNEGDLIKDNGEYYFVTQVATTNTMTQTLSARTGEVKSVVPIKNILGFSCYSKVIALSDKLDMGGNMDLEELAIMSTMWQNGENGGQMNPMLPMILYKDKFGLGEDETKLMLMSAMMYTQTPSGQNVQENGSSQNSSQNMNVNQLLPLMLIGKKNGETDDSTKWLLMASMMGGNAAGGNNLMMTYLMYDMLKGRSQKEDTSESGEDTAK